MFWWQNKHLHNKICVLFLLILKGSGQSTGTARSACAKYDLLRRHGFHRSNRPLRHWEWFEVSWASNWRSKVMALPVCFHFTLHINVQTKSNCINSRVQPQMPQMQKKSSSVRYHYFSTKHILSLHFYKVVNSAQATLWIFVFPLNKYTLFFCAV